MNDFNGRTGSGFSNPHPIAGVLLPLALFGALVVFAVYWLYRFSDGFEFYHPLQYGPFHAI